MERYELRSIELWSAYRGCGFLEGPWIQRVYPDCRALFFPGKVHIPRSLARRIRKRDYEVTFDQAFLDVVRACKRPCGWICGELEIGYEEAFQEGWAHSCEVWRDGNLAGGVFGVGIGKVFLAESMFHREPYMGKIALVHLLDRCFELGFQVVDGEQFKDDLARHGAVGCTNYAFSLMTYDWMEEETPWSPKPKALRT
ncbi:MAG: leucyl/phenylalanyl-tRNA--protein transferase [Fimbriimonadaceae bacterium]